VEDSGPGRSLTRRQFDAVIRRAAELARADADGVDGALSEDELFRIASEVGLSDRHVRQALSEVRSGVGSTGVVDRWFGPASVQATRTVPGASASIASEVDDFLVASRLLQRVRRSAEVLQYRPALDWASKLARAASSSSSKYYIASARSVEVRLAELDDGKTEVELRVDPGTRPDDLAGALVGGGVGASGVGVFVAVSLTPALPVAVATGVAVLAGAGVWLAIGQWVGRNHRRKVEEVKLEVEAVLDALEAGGSLEPPPASWRRWVKRHFHGVARDLLDVDE
jgi:hypothetical protein